MATHDYLNPKQSDAMQDSSSMDYPPPEYRESDPRQPAPEKQPPPPTKYHQASSQYQSQSQSQPQPSPSPRLLHIYHEGLTHRHMKIVDSDKQTTLYTITANSGSIFSAKPHILITAGDSPASSSTFASPSNPSYGVVGSITFPKFSRHLDLEIHGQPLTLNSAGWLSNGMVFDSAASGGEKLTWERESVFGSGLVMRNTRNEWIAKFDRSMFTMSKVGKLELPGPEVSGPLLDEVVVSGIAIVELARRRRNNSSGAAGGGGGSC